MSNPFATLPSAADVYTIVMQMDLWSLPTQYPTIWILVVYQQTCLISSNNPSVTKLHY